MLTNFEEHTEDLNADDYGDVELIKNWFKDKANPETWYTQAEIAEHTRVKHGKIPKILQRIRLEMDNNYIIIGSSAGNMKTYSIEHIESYKQSREEDIRSRVVSYIILCEHMKRITRNDFGIQTRLSLRIDGNEVTIKDINNGPEPTNS